MNILSEGARPYPPTSVTPLTAETAASSALAAPTGYVVFKCLATTDANNTGVRLLFSTTSTVTDPTTGASSNSFLLAPGESVPWYIPTGWYFKHIRNGSADAPFLYTKSGD